MKLMKIQKNLSAFSDLDEDYMSLEMPKDILSLSQHYSKTWRSNNWGNTPFLGT